MGGSLLAVMAGGFWWLALGREDDSDGMGDGCGMYRSVAGGAAREVWRHGGRSKSGNGK